MRKAFLLACALLISFALLLLPSTEARALLPGEDLPARMAPPATECSKFPQKPCTPVRPPSCGYQRRCPPGVSPTEP
ncbi:hypothetical protein EUGRSUZ_G00423 [Eucalyptus grandis]|uniref:Uncharacterized protein n=2 Tax=Eucalyptus grandis TaxID=71139 RepID=A0ACC3K1C3_EUCGR|nr:hypothetical protein EUGRSUZ_G00423 [Eucalyptus grandis]